MDNQRFKGARWAMSSTADITPHVLILGGTTESRLLAERLQARGDMAVTLSLAGRTQAPLTQPAPTRIGGFGGVDGLVRYLVEAKIACLIDATHPFAAQISKNARAAAQQTHTPMVTLSRPAWRRQPDDAWTEVPDMESAVDALGQVPRRVFVTSGRQGLAALLRAPQHHYWIRTVDRVEPPLNVPHAQYITDIGPFTEDSERTILVSNGIDVIIAKNSGGAASYAKILVARALRLPVVLIRRKESAASGAADDVDTALHQVLSALGLGIERGV
jgi:precorrin-6A/cobalt-precorrin-6A reductase